MKKIYVRNDVAIAEKSSLKREGEVFNIAVPADTIAHYNYYTRMFMPSRIYIFTTNTILPHGRLTAEIS